MITIDEWTDEMVKNMSPPTKAELVEITNLLKLQMPDEKNDE